MKKLIVLLLPAIILAVLPLTSCSDDKPTQIKITIFNDTSYELEAIAIDPTYMLMTAADESLLPGQQREFTLNFDNETARYSRHIKIVGEEMIHDLVIEGIELTNGKVYQITRDDDEDEMAFRLVLKP
jgi:hypothetical protein